jgi:TRAP-type C4-dicarboxylate transport system permease small subunit
MKALLRGVDWMNAAVTLAVGLLLALMSIAVMGQVTVRFVLTAAGINVSAPWTEELARYCLIWMIFLGAGVGVRRAQMIALEFLVRKVPAVVGVAMRYVVIALSIAFFGLLLKVGLDFAELGRSERSPVMGITKDYVYWAMPVGAVLMIINSIALVAQSIIEKRDIRFIGESLVTE